jgi:hypothetical protein
MCPKKKKIFKNPLTMFLNGTIIRLDEVAKRDIKREDKNEILPKKSKKRSWPHTGRNS